MKKIIGLLFAILLLFTSFPCQVTFANMETTKLNTTFISMAYSEKLNLFVAIANVTSNGEIYTSKNGMAWVKKVANAPKFKTGSQVLVISESEIVALTETSDLYVSIDSINWSVKTQTKNFVAIIYDGVRFIAATKGTSNGYVCTSFNLENWIESKLDKATNDDVLLASNGDVNNPIYYFSQRNITKLYVSMDGGNSWNELDTQWFYAIGADYSAQSNKFIVLVEHDSYVSGSVVLSGAGAPKFQINWYQPGSNGQASTISTNGTTFVHGRNSGKLYVAQDSTSFSGVDWNDILPKDTAELSTDKIIDIASSKSGSFVAISNSSILYINAESANYLYQKIQGYYTKEDYIEITGDAELYIPAIGQPSIEKEYKAIVKNIYGETLNTDVILKIKEPLTNGINISQNKLIVGSDATGGVVTLVATIDNLTKEFSVMLHPAPIISKIDISGSGIITIPPLGKGKFETNYTSIINAENGEIINQKVSWSVKNSPAGVFIDENGKLAVNEGVTGQKIAVVASYGGVSGEIEIALVREASLSTKIDITGVTTGIVPLSNSNQYTFATKIKDQYGDDIVKPVKWKIENRQSGTDIDELSGLFTVKSGTRAYTAHILAESDGIFGDIFVLLTEEKAPPVSGGSSGGSYVPAKKINVISKEDTQTNPALPKAEVFSDIKDVTWATDAINYLCEKKVLKGMDNNLFAPNDVVTRAQFVKMLILGLDILDEKSESTFADIKKEDWYYSEIATAQKLGICNGYEDNRFNPNSQISRQEMATMAYNATKYANVKFDAYSNLEIFQDEDTIAPFALEAVRSLKSVGIIKGKPNGYFYPIASTTRAEATVMIYNLIK